MPVEGDVLDAEEEPKGFVRRPREGTPEEERWPPEPLTLSTRPLPDVVFGTPEPVVAASGETSGNAAEPGETTGPQPVVGAAPAGPVEGDGAHRRRMALLVAVVVVGVVVVVLAAMAVWPSGNGEARPNTPSPTASQPGAVPEDGEKTDTPGAAPQVDPGDGSPEMPGNPAVPVVPAASVSGLEEAAGGPALAGTTSQGIEVTYRTVETADGYFEGELKLVNATDAPLPDWTLSFTYPGASIRNVWGGDFQPGEDGTVVVTGNGHTTPVAVGAWVSVRFGGSGTPSRPRDCTVNGAACGF